MATVVKLWIVDQDGHRSLARIITMGPHAAKERDINRAVNDLERFLKTRTDPYTIKIEETERKDG